MLKKRWMLTEKEKEICLNYLKCRNKLESFRMSGIEIKHYSTVYKFFERKIVNMYLVEMVDLLDEKIDEKEIMEKIARVARRLETEDVALSNRTVKVRQSIRDQLKALEMLCKLKGIDKVTNNDSKVTIIDDIVSAGNEENGS